MEKTLIILFLSVITTVHGKIDFTRQVLPILSENCYFCHGPDAQERKADLRLDYREDALAQEAFVSGDPASSKIIQRIFHQDAGELMPPPKSERALSEAQKATLHQWILEGAEYKTHWAFEPVERPDVPKEVNPIDHFTKPKAQPADPRRLIRRVTLDLTGLPPTADEIEAFVEDTTVNAYEKVVDRLLASPRYGEHMALGWMDAARYADTDGYQNDGLRYMWRWRDWVIEAYNRNLPFDQFTIEQLAGDLLPNATLEQRIATGFNRNHRYNSESGLVLEEFLLENAVDRVDTTATLWMGLTMGCARCHDHKYDPISTKEYYQLVSFFNNVPESGRAVKFGNSEPWITAPTKSQAERLANMEKLVESSKVLPTDRDESLVPWAALPGQTHHYSLEKIGKKQLIQQGTPKFASGKVDKGVRFDGNTRVNLKDAVTFNCHSPFSLSFWMRPDQVEDAVFISNQAKNPRRPGLAIALHKGHVQFRLITRWVAGAAIVESKPKLRSGEWTHVTVTNDGSQSATGMRIYLNGRPVETTILNNTNSNTGGNKGPIQLGGGVIGSGYKGMLDEVRIFNRNLWDDEIGMLAKNHITFTAQDKPFHNARLALEKYHRSIQTSMVMVENSTIKKTFIRNRGVYHSHGEEVERDVPAIFPGMTKDMERNRLGFAKWLVSGDHPLVARVTVNRYWQRYFGIGLVKTAEDFGRQGELPSHPELLDWLASEFVRTGWDVKSMQKLIVSSATYKQSSKASEKAYRDDPENRSLQRGPRNRLPAHTLRDQALAIGGLLHEQLGGPSVSPYQPENFWEQLSNMRYKQSKGVDLYRRSLYTIWKRTLNPPSMAILDAAERENCSVNIKRTNTPLQALTLLNEKMFVEAARKFGERILGEGVQDPIGFAFQTATGRLPEVTERHILESAFKQYKKEYSAKPAEAKKLIQVGDSKSHARFDPVELAAATTLANVLLNLDEVITKE